MLWRSMELQRRLESARGMRRGRESTGGRMIPRSVRAFVLCLLTALGGGVAAADQPADLLARKLAELPGADRGQIIAVTDRAVSAAFPDYHFYVLRFRQYPVAMVPPEPLGANNLFVVKPDSAVEQIRDAPALENFFRAALTPVTTADHAKEAATAWLRLAEEFHQDGFFQFSIPDDSLHVTSDSAGGLRIMGKAIASGQSGNGGEITASLVFDQAGRLAKASEVASLKRGIRPICQATKLLDPDPIVRGMAEQALLVMGKAAKDYLQEQRARANPELRAAIDRIWQQILSEGR